MPHALPITIDSVVIASADLMSSEVDGELVMMDVEQGTYYGLDPVAARIWDAISAPTRLADVCDKLMEQYDVDAQTCQEEVIAFVDQLHQAGMVSIVEAR